MRIEALAPQHERAAFRCGAPSLDKYIHAQAGRDAAKQLAAVFVAVMAEERLAGYYSLCAATVLLPDLLGGGARTVSRYPALRAARLTRLAVDKKYRGQGLAAALLADAMARLRAAPLPPLALIAEAPNETARHFLTHAGFSAFADQEQRAFKMLQSV